MASPFTDAEKKTAVLVELVKAGVVDLSSFADSVVKRLPADFDPNNPNVPPGTGLGGGATFGSFIGPWYVSEGTKTT